MGFHSIQLLERARAFKLYLRKVGIRAQIFAAKSGISENAAYSYLDPERLDKNLPAVLIPELNPPQSRQILLYLLGQLQKRTLFQDAIRPGGVKPIMKQYSNMLKEFANYSKKIIETLEDGSISQQELSQYESYRASFYAAEMQLYDLILAVAGKSMEDIIYGKED